MEYRGGTNTPRSHIGFVTTNMIIEFLETFGYRIINAPTSNIANINRVVYTDSIQDFAGKGDNILCLYDKNSAHSCNPEEAHALLLFLEQDESLEDEAYSRFSEDAWSRCIAVKGSSNATNSRKLQGDVTNYLLSVDEYMAASNLAALSSHSLQPLVDIAEHYFNRFISIVDPNNMLLAYTKGIEPQDSVSASLIKLRYHSNEMLATERGRSYVSEKIMRQTGIEVYPSDDVFPYSLVTSPITVNGHYAGYVVMCCPEEDITPGTIDSFSLLIGHCSKLLRQQVEAPSLQNDFTQDFFLHLMTKKDISNSYIKQQGALLDIPMSGNYVLLAACWDKTYSTQLPFFIDEVNRSKGQFSLAVSYDNKVLILLNAENVPRLAKTRENLICEYPLCQASSIYSSDYFSKLSEVYYAFKSILAIQKYEHLLAMHAAPSTLGPAFIKFSDVFTFYSNDPCGDAEIRDYVMDHLLIDVIRDQDAEKGTNDLALLCAYLIKERKASSIAPLFHLHRNGVVYRISKMELRYDFSLDRSLDRMYLQTCFFSRLASDVEFAREIMGEIGPLG